MLDTHALLWWLRSETLLRLTMPLPSLANPMETAGDSISQMADFSRCGGQR